MRAAQPYDDLKMLPRIAEHENPQGLGRRRRGGESDAKQAAQRYAAMPSGWP